MGIKDYVTPVCGGLVRAGQPWPTKAISNDYIIPRMLFLSAFYCVSPFLLFLLPHLHDDDGDMHQHPWLSTALFLATGHFLFHPLLVRLLSWWMDGLCWSLVQANLNHISQKSSNYEKELTRKRVLPGRCPTNSTPNKRAYWVTHQLPAVWERRPRVISIAGQLTKVSPLLLWFQTNAMLQQFISNCYTKGWIRKCGNLSSEYRM